MRQKIACQFFGETCLLENGLALIIGCTCKKYTSFGPNTTITHRNKYDVTCLGTTSIIVLGVFCDVKEYVEYNYSLTCNASFQSVRGRFLSLSTGVKQFQPKIVSLQFQFLIHNPNDLGLKMKRI